MIVKDIMSKDVIAVDKDVDLEFVLKLMKKHDITKIPVVNEKKLTGIITDNLIAYKLGAIRSRGVPAARMHASTVTEKNFETITPGTDVKVILKKVGEPGPTMLPVVENDMLVGVLTKADLLPLVNCKRKLRDLLPQQLHIIDPDDRVVHARRIMINENVARLPVTDQGKLIGIISDTEIAFAFALVKKSFPLGKQKHKLDELLVKDVMKTPVNSVNPEMTATEAAKVMIKKNIGSLPVVEKGKVIGMITRTDLLKTVPC